MSIAQKLTAVAENAPKVYEAGEQAAYDRFWDEFQDKGARTNYIGAFNTGWTAALFRPKYNMAVDNAYSMFNNFLRGKPASLKQLLAESGVSLTFPGCININNVFQASHTTELGELDFSTVTRKDCGSLFYDCGHLKSIDKLIIPAGQTTFSNWFRSCNALERLTIEGMIGANGFDVSWSPLDHDSLMSIVEALQDYSTAGVTGTVTLGADNLAKLSDGEKAIATQKGWTLV